MSIPRLRPARAIVALAIAALAVSACSGPASSAATVGEVTISEQTLADGVAELASTPESGATADDPAVVAGLLDQMIKAALVDQLAAEHDLDVTRGQVQAELDEYSEQVGGRDAVDRVFAQQGVPASQVEPVVRMTLQLTALGPALLPDGSGEEQNQAIIAAIVDLGEREAVTVNPRWGTWDPQTLNLGPVSDDLATTPS
jgi:hypothetical protein